MKVSLTPELEQFIQSQVESGKYKSPEEVIIASITLLEVWERMYKEHFEGLRKEAKGWMPGFFEEVIGGWVGEPLQRATD
ncbi:ribbon-helix-helix domain-containing protein [Iningainema tapete]|uniref:Type II toxin-antitoxin system ParD family antitoxin n=1 Tax=Iningainema tapete BLCC-T55 TaxID=2748662 RepID=A0A8J6XEU1_9CYAN|nr:type II toxin-antitoxin system ParD family antitoxin [Iningainema tapete]MBD2774264.1 type II toxin-antitoxin system ParD family antitoxin [Iningainema tapete BLCC-T55]